MMVEKPHWDKINSPSYHKKAKKFQIINSFGAFKLFKN